MSPEPQLLGVRAYARRRGVTHQAVSKAIATGRLLASVRRDRAGRPVIDADQADREWSERTDANQQRERHRRPSQETMFGDDPEPRNGSPAAPVLAKAQAMRVTYLAKTAELDYLERSRVLVRADEVEVEAFRCAREVRDAILNVPSRVAAQLAALSDEHQVHEVLTAELHAALLSLSGKRERAG